MLSSKIRDLGARARDIGGDKDAKDKRFYRDPLVHGAAAGGLLAIKLDKDLRNVSQGLDKWEKSMAPHAEIALSGKGNVASSIRAIDEYNRGAEALSKQRILGVRAGTLMSNGQGMFQEGLRARERIGKRFIKGYNPHIISDAEIAAIKNHYKLYAKKGVTRENMLAHIIDKGVNDLRLSDHDLHEAVKKDPNISKFIRDLSNSKGNVGKQILNFKHQSPESYARLKQVIAGGRWAPGEAKMLSGNKADFISVPKIYRENLTPIIGGLRKALPYIALGGAGYVGYRMVDDAIEDMRKKAEKKNTDVLDAAMTGAGVVAISEGAKRKIHRDIGITYGTMPGIGEGHSSPGRAIKKILEGDNRFKGINIDLLERDPHGVFIGTGKKYNTIIDTGLGAYIPSNHFDQVHKTHGHNIPLNINAKTRVGYLTDVVHPGGHTSGAIRPPSTGKQPFITYGPFLDRMAGKEHVKHINAGHNMTPALDKDVIKEIATKKYDKAGVLDDMIAHIRSTVKDPADMKAQIQGLESLKGKKIITISGSGRGDYVYARARQLAIELRRAKMDGEYGILALSANGKGSPMAKLIRGKNVVDIGRLPKGIFVGAQNIAEAHWGSTGTSSMMESIVSDKPQLLQDVWGGNFDVKRLGKGSIADYQERLLRRDPAYQRYSKHIKHVETDNWNRGNRAMMKELPGVATVGHARDVVSTVSNKDTMRTLASDSVKRQADNYSGYKKQVKNMADDLHGIYKKNIRNDYIGKLLMMAGGAALVGTGTYRLLRKDNTTDRK